MNLATQDLCEAGQAHLMAMRYLQAEAALMQAEAAALAEEDWDSLARLYMPLQECRRQRRQRCGEGTVCLDLVAESAGLQPDPRRIAADHPHGQLLVAGWGSIEPAVQLRRLAAERGLYVETYLAAAYPLPGGARAIAIVPTADVALPAPDADQPVDRLVARLPPHSIVLSADQLPRGPRPGDARTYAFTMSLWERLHQPFLAAADQTADPRRRIMSYRRSIEVDYACELAHQRLSATARQLLAGARVA